MSISGGGGPAPLHLKTIKRGKRHNQPYIFITRKLFMTFGNAQFVDSGSTKVRCIAISARSRRTRDFHVEQECHLAVILRKGAVATGSVSFSESQPPRRQAGETLYWQKRREGNESGQEKRHRKSGNGSRNCADKLKKNGEGVESKKRSYKLFFSRTEPPSPPFQVPKFWQRPPSSL